LFKQSLLSKTKDKKIRQVPIEIVTTQRNDSLSSIDIFFCDSQWAEIKFGQFKQIHQENIKSVENF
jgi:hypothetical protein